MGFGVSVFLRETEIDNVDLVPSLTDTHEEVVGFDVTVNKVSRVDILDTGDKLVGEKEDGLEGELAVAKVEQVLERGATDNVSR